MSPDPIHRADLFSNRWRGFAGSAIQISSIEGDTSGRFEVARFIARVYPAHRDFVQNVIAEGIEPASAFPSGPYPTDKLTYRSKEIVEYVTPANTMGLGTNSHLQQNEDPISGVAILAGEALDLVHLSVRLPPQDNELIRIIVRQTERDAQ
ncbi:MAG TPA: hypothetical protein VHD85_03320 [Terracidiphilus sp.]|nr:hypothetical protein [Terracidiphilus sp.]